MEALKARAAQSDELDPQRLYVFMDILIGRNMGRDPRPMRGRLIFETTVAGTCLRLGAPVLELLEDLARRLLRGRRPHEPD